MSRTKQGIIPWPDAAALEADRQEEERDYLAWVRRAIAARRWNRQCPSRRCRRNGCQDARRCEPQFRAGLDHVRVALQHAVLEENAHPKEAHEGKRAAERRALLAHARTRGLLPL